MSTEVEGADLGGMAGLGRVLFRKQNKIKFGIRNFEFECRCKISWEKIQRKRKKGDEVEKKIIDNSYKGKMVMVLEEKNRKIGSENKKCFCFKYHKIR